MIKKDNVKANHSGTIETFIFVDTNFRGLKETLPFFSLYSILWLLLNSA